ncbi:hypothetical protein DRQ26_05490 [bacterium]|nr:MAG: hypothetical protein DRQ26_05490 [bacterium]
MQDEFSDRERSNSLIDLLKTIWRDFIDFLFPPSCQLCGKFSEKVVCDECANSLETLDAGYCPVCERKIPADIKLCPGGHHDGDNYIDFVRPLAPFDSPHRELIHLLKYSGVVDVAKFFGEKIGEIVRNELHFSDYDAFIPVPLHKNRHRERRYNQAELIAEAASKRAKLPVLKDVVVRVRHTKSQTKLGANERRANVRGAFAVVKPDEVAGRSFIVVDDVVTTGATTSEIAKELRKAGAKNVCAICIAHPTRDESKRYSI